MRIEASEPQRIFPFAARGVLRPSPYGVRDPVQRIALEFPVYGCPRMTRELGPRDWVGNHNRLYRMIREDYLLCLRRRKFVRATDSAYRLQVYPDSPQQAVVIGLDHP